MVERDRKARVVAIVALLIGVVGLSLGFAALSNTLTIKSSAEVDVDEDVLNVDFTTSTASIVDGTGVITPTLDPATDGPTGAAGDIDNSAAGAPVVQNLHATFTAPGQTVTYTFYTKNIGAIKAYLTNVTFAAATGASNNETKVCTAKSGGTATQSLVDSACEGISLTMTLGSEDFTASKTRAQFATATAHDLEVDATETVVITITYATGSAQADGDFDVAFGDITLNYSSIAS